MVNEGYLTLVFYQIDRCNAAKPEELHDTTLKLRLLCEPFADEQYLTEVGNIEEELKSEAEYEDLDPDKTDYYKAGVKILSACLSLLKRKGLIEE